MLRRTVHTHTHKHTNSQTHTHTQTHTHKHTQTHTYTHKHTHTNTHTLWPLGDLPNLLSFLKKLSVLHTAAATPPCTVALAATL